ncbi:MAG: hypothetical protein JXL80_17725, partial [Planctomycetes bacterium]|nr:hypothetical protein [Planctomycetota bacterium]
RLQDPGLIHVFPAKRQLNQACEAAGVIGVGLKGKLEVSFGRCEFLLPKAGLGHPRHAVCNAVGGQGSASVICRFVFPVVRESIPSLFHCLTLLRPAALTSRHGLPIAGRSCRNSQLLHSWHAHG